MNALAEETHRPNRALVALSVAALGVVFGDIATSPLYAINEIFFGHGNVSTEPAHVIGAISLAVWALIIVISIKYLLFVLRADNDGQGGVYALYGILHRARKRGEWFILSLLMLSAGMLFGDGIITPAISVLAAVEGLKVAAPSLASYVVPITVIILVFLFAAQRFGTSVVGAIFGPIVILWLLTLAYLGGVQVIAHPEILAAFDLRYGIDFLRDVGGFKALLVLGAVMLVITGGEALYADMGHFGRAPIRLGWFALVFPSLLLNYLGQGAFLLGGERVIGGNIFYSMVPQQFLMPMVLLATMATIIASQALISGAFSLTMQAVGLGLFPRVRMIHTHEKHHGQIYIPFTNWALCLGCILLVDFFRTSSALASAYGLAVAGDMVTTSLAMTVVARRVWQWPWVLSLGLFGGLAVVDGGFLVANSLKFLEGGFIPLSLGVAMFVIMSAWSWGRSATFMAYRGLATSKMRDIVIQKQEGPVPVDHTAILMCPKAIHSETDQVPVLLQQFVDRYGILPKNLILLDVHHRLVPYVHRERYQVRKFYSDPTRGSITSVTVHFGFMEEPNVEAYLEELASHHEIALTGNPLEWHVVAAKERLLPAPGLSKTRRLMLNLYSILRQNSVPAYYFYGLGTTTKLSIDVFPIRIS